jgi:aspartyl-tRNA(Asn)/glutamyl-tRNA(Gln) amidotransferase subunit A
MNPADLTIAEAGARLRDGSLGTLELCEAHLARIVARDPICHAFVTVTGERARADARAAARELREGLDRGPLHGIPVALKDLIDTAGIRTTNGSRVHWDRVPDEDAEVAMRLRAAGAVLLGKVQTYEFAVVGPSFDLPLPPAANPWNTAHITGGSSSGSAAAVAGGLVRTTLGSDTGGSIRSPASYCGVVGLKPTYGRVSKAGVFPLSPSLDHVGPISASVEEAALTLDAISDAGAATEIGRDIAGLRIGYARAWFVDRAPAPILHAMDDAVSQLSLLGARIEEVVLPDYAVFEAAGAVILHAEAMEVHRALLAERGEAYGKLAYQSILSALGLDTDDVLKARQAAGLLREQMDGLLGEVDALVTVNTLSTALPFSDFDGESVVWTEMRTIPFNVTQQPVLAVPIGLSQGLPMGMQIVGRSGAEARICRIGHAYERATDFAAMRVPGVG